MRQYCDKCGNEEDYSPGERRIMGMLEKLDRKVNKMKADDDALLAAVTAETNGEQAVVALLNGIAKQLSDAQAAANTPDPAIAAVIDQINNNTAAMAAAVVANTPAAPAP